MRRRNDTEYDDRESFSPWETFSDLYCGLLLVFALLFFFAIYQYVDARERNNADTTALQAEMEAEQASVLAIYKADLEDQEAGYREKSEQLEEQMALVEEQAGQLEEQRLLMEEQAGQLELQRSRLGEQESLIEEQKKLLDEQSDQIEQIIGVQGLLVEELNRELTSNQIQIQADSETGAIVFESSILFERDSNELIEEGKAFFARFMPVYLEVLMRPQFREYIAEIIIEGHTDDTGSYLHNLELSQQRARSVAEYLLADDCEFLTEDMIAALKSFVTVNGCADKAPVYREDGTVDADKSRRVEIKFRLKDQDMIRRMDEILKNED